MYTAHKNESDGVVVRMYQLHDAVAAAKYSKVTGNTDWLYYYLVYTKDSDIVFAHNCDGGCTLVRNDKTKGILTFTCGTAD